MLALQFMLVTVLLQWLCFDWSHLNDFSCKQFFLTLLYFLLLLKNLAQLGILLQVTFVDCAQRLLQKMLCQQHGVVGVFNLSTLS